MVFGNLNDKSGTGVAFTRNPSSGLKELYGEYLINAQGEDVVAGIRTPHPIREDKNVDQESMESKFPNAYKEILEISTKLEHHFKEVQYIELTFENDNISLLYKSDDADEEDRVDIGGRRIINK